MEYGYYPGCSLHGTAKEFDLSIKESMSGLGLKLVEVPDWNCCGASAAHSTNEELALALSARVLGLAKNNNLNSVMVPCAACYSRLKVANKAINKDAKILRRMSDLIGMEYDGSVEVKHVIEVLMDNTDALTASVSKPLKGMKVASYYGCLLVRPPEIANFDDTENPVTMDNIVTILGADAVDWSHKTECCGASFSISRADSALRLVDAIMEAAQFANADVIAVACPLCHANLDMRQEVAAKKYGKDYSIPILYISQLIGLAQGKNSSDLGLGKHMVSTDALLSSKFQMARAL